MDSVNAELQEDGCYVALTPEPLSVQDIMNRVRRPDAGAIVMFAGTTRDNFGGKPVKELRYSAYQELALRSMMGIAKALSAKHSLKAIAMVHRLGVVPIGEESILIAVSTAHRQAAWRAGEEALEDCKARVEIWKREEFDGEEGVWRANRDGVMGQRVLESETEIPIPLSGPVIRPRALGERGHGPVVHLPPPRPSHEDGQHEQ